MGINDLFAGIIFSASTMAFAWSLWVSLFKELVKTALHGPIVILKPAMRAFEKKLVLFPKRDSSGRCRWRSS